MHENREISSTPWSDDQGRSAKATSRTVDMYVPEKSDCAVVPVNQPNKGGQLSTEAAEGRAQKRENLVQPRMRPTQSGEGMTQISEVAFKGFSYGSRPGRSPREAMDALTVGVQRKRVNWVLDADIRGFFDNLSHAWTMKFVEHRVADRRILRLIRKWLKAGVSEDGQWSETKLGTPQGAVASPLLANVYLHYLFDLWADVWRRKVAKGD